MNYGSSKTIGERCSSMNIENTVLLRHPLYPEHNEQYLKECVENLKKKGIDLIIK